jgi:hypothetical protein
MYSLRDALETQTKFCIPLYKESKIIITIDRPVVTSLLANSSAYQPHTHTHLNTHTHTLTLKSVASGHQGGKSGFSDSFYFFLFFWIVFYFFGFFQIFSDFFGFFWIKI